MYRSKPANIICAALFIGTLLSCAFYFGITAFMNPTAPDNGTSGEYGISFEAFSDAFYDSANLSEFVGKCEYLIFKSVGQDDIILGANDFLFEAGTTEDGYNYLDDYLGIGRFNGYELVQLEKFLDLRRIAYMNQGVEYLLVVIPNSQTVYGDYMPSYIEAMRGGTRLEQLTAYLHGMGYDFFFNATDALLSAKTPYIIDQLYNNTENSLNSLGEWYLYSAVCDKLGELYGIEGTRLSDRSLSRYINYNDGKVLARAAGLSQVIKNRTVSLSDSAVIKYTNSVYYGNMIRTVFEEKHKPEKGSKVLLEFTDEWDKIQLMPYFSNTFDEVTYKSNHYFSSFVVGKLKPDVVVQFIHEYELFDIANQDISQTYSASLRLDTDDFVTAKPIIIAQCQTGPTTVCVVGRAESGALITVSGEGIAPVSQRAAGSLFFIEIDTGSPLTTTVKLAARVDDKAASESVSLLLRRSAEVGQTPAVVGNNSQLYSNDYSSMVFYGEEQLEAVGLSLEQKVIRAGELSGKDTEFIYLIVPDKLSVYGEDAPGILADKAGMVSKYKAMVKRVREGAGMKVIDLTEEMLSHFVFGRLYYQTDTLWTEAGAYIGYFTLMSEIAEKFSEVKPLSISSFEFLPGENIGGGLVTRLGLDRAIISERFVTLHPVFESVVNFEQSGAVFDITKAFISYNNSDGTLPVAIVMRDEFGTGMLENMAEHFSKMYVLNEGIYSISDEQIAALRPDYIITIRCNGDLS